MTSEIIKELEESEIGVILCNKEYIKKSLPPVKVLNNKMRSIISSIKLDRGIVLNIIPVIAYNAIPRDTYYLEAYFLLNYLIL